MQNEKLTTPRKPRRQTRQDVIDGLRVGYSYCRAYSLDSDMRQGTESLVPIGRGPEFIEVQHTCVVTGDEGDETNSGTEDLDDGLCDIVVNGLRWARF